MKTRIERLGPGAWKRLRDLRLAALADAPEAFERTLAEEAGFAEERWIERLTGESANFLAVCDGVDVGIVATAPHLGTPDLVGLYGMWVAPTHRRAGLGRLLVGAVLDRARKLEGCHGVVLDVNDDNLAAISLYESLGFLPNGKHGVMPPPREHVREHQRVHLFGTAASSRTSS